MIKEEHILQTDYLTTLLVVISKFNVKEWLSCYEKLNPFVVCPSPCISRDDVTCGVVY